MIALLLALALPPPVITIDRDGRGKQQQTWHVLMEHGWRMPLIDGVTDCAAKEITISDEQMPEEMKDTLIHELFHAMTGCNAKRMNSKSENGHEGIYYISPRWTWVLTHNPELLKYLQAN